MTIDEWTLRDTARHLANLYRELDALKYQPPAPRETRVMKPRPGPSTPGNWYAMCLDADLVDHLVEMVCDARSYIDPSYTVGRNGHTLCEWIAFNANAIATDFPAVEELHDLMTGQVKRIADKIPVRESEHEDQRSEPWQRREVILQRLARKGVEVSRGQLRKWSQRQKIDTRIGADGTARYLWSQVAAVLKLQEPDEVSRDQAHRLQ